MLSNASKSRHDGDLLAVVLIAPAAAVVIAAMLLPLVYAFTMSLFDFRPGFETQGKFLFLQNFLRFVTGTAVGRWLFHSSPDNPSVGREGPPRGLLYSAPDLSDYRRVDMAIHVRSYFWNRLFYRETGRL